MKKRGDTKPLKALVVDDDPAWLDYIAAVIPKARLALCSKPETALSLIKKGDVGLVVTDTNMPGLNGVELLKAIRKDESLVNLPVLILFNGLYGSPMTAEEVYLLGATVVLTKSEFVQSIEIVLANYLP